MTNVVKLDFTRRDNIVKPTKPEEQRIWDLRYNLDRLLADYSDLTQFTLTNELSVAMASVEAGIFGKK